MKIPMSQAVDVLVNYMVGEVAKVPRPTDKFLLYAALGAAKANSSSVLGRYLPALTTVGIIDGENMVCTDTVRSALESAFNNVPSVDFMGFTFTASDAAEIMRRMEA
ncbi:MAG: hypothetical protein MJY89_06320 [Bacteroidales bacterium]|nr:hypothetical protein [Bacteroidales bacterium]